MGIANIINNSTTTSGGEIVRELVNSSDGAGLHFDGSAGNIDIASPPDLGTKFSFEFVLKADSWDSYQTIFDFGTGGRFQLYTTNGTQLKIYQTSAHDFTGVSVLGDLKVHHLVLTVDGTSAVLYDNGNQVATTSIESPNIDSCSDARIGSNFSGSASGSFNGTIYRARFYNHTLSADEVRTAFERADVDYSSQYGSETDLVNANSSGSGTAWTGASGVTAPNGWSAAGSSRTYTIDSATGNPAPSLKIEAGSPNIGIKWGGTAVLGKRYQATFSYKCGDAATTLAYRLNDADSFVNLDNSTSWATKTVEWIGDGVTGGFMLRVNESGKFGHFDTVSIKAIGCVSDYQTQWANPTQSLTVQDASGAADGTCSASGVTQVQPVVQLNSTSARIGTFAATPADGQILVDGGAAATPSYSFGHTTATGMYSPGANQIRFSTASTDRLTLASTGAVSIPGADAAASKLTVGNIHGELILNNTSGTSGSTVLSQTYNGSTAELRIGSNVSGTGTSAMNISTGNAGIVTFNGGINLSSGNILVGKTVTADTETGSVLNATQMRQSAAGTVAHDFHDFYRGTAGSLARVGHIRTTGTATSYNTSSDYRLKENLEPLTGALDRIDQLPVYRFNFTSDPDTTVDGFVAHEVSAHVPEAVTGEKDAMKTVVVQEAVEAQPATYYEEGDELPEGKAVGDEKTPAVEAVEEVTEEQPDYQGIDQSKLVPLLVAAVKELKAKVETLENV